ncbi:MAG: GIY-YIG nuclease family protein [Chitinophagales bacterium]|nr:GIY-YIG nuclease family protein [Chitinophagales bacterium]
MFFVYILHSASSGKTYTGFTINVERRLEEHNIAESSGFTLRYRPWTLIHTEPFEKKAEAMKREKYLKTGKGREEIKRIIQNYLDNLSVRYPPQAEKD